MQTPPLRSPGCTVIKVGGSLFDLPELSGLLDAVLLQRRQTHCCLVAGGGWSADAVRKWQRLHGLTESAAHEIAIESMRCGATLLESLIPGSRAAGSRTEVERLRSSGGCTVIDAAGFIRAEEPSSGNALRLAKGWSVTSDSIAAWIAARLEADELILLKSVNRPTTGFRSDSVDDDFHIHASALPRVSWCNLRAEPIGIESFHSSGQVSETR